MFPVITIDEFGVVTRANPKAKDLLGECVGSRCCDVVSAKGIDGQVICSHQCGKRLVKGGQSHPSFQVVVGGEVSMLNCTCLDDIGVISIQPSEFVPQEINPLSPRERQVLSLAGKGMTAKLMAETLKVKPSTVRTHVENARNKLGAHTRAEAVATAITKGFIEIDF